MWYCNLGRLRLAQNDHTAAQAALETALRAARQTAQGVNWEAIIRHFLGLCERGELSARERTVHQVGPPSGACRESRQPAQKKRKPSRR